MIIQINDENGLRTKWCNVVEIANDGIYLDAGIAPRYGKSVVPPGGRVDWVVECVKAGRYVVSLKEISWVFIK